MLDCNVTLKGYQGAIELPKLENMSINKCAWTIVAPKRSRVNITFTSLKLFHSRFVQFNNILSSSINSFKARWTNSQLNVSIITNIIVFNLNTNL